MAIRSQNHWQRHQSHQGTPLTAHQSLSGGLTGGHLREEVHVQREDQRQEKRLEDFEVDAESASSSKQMEDLKFLKMLEVRDPAWVLKELRKKTFQRCSKTLYCLGSELWRSWKTGDDEAMEVEATSASQARPNQD